MVIVSWRTVHILISDVLYRTHIRALHREEAIELVSEERNAYRHVWRIDRAGAESWLELLRREQIVNSAHVEADIRVREQRGILRARIRRRRLRRNGRRQYQHPSEHERQVRRQWR